MFIQDVLRATFHWFQLARPTPTSKDFNVQIGCHFEEVAEMIEELSPLDQETGDLCAAALYSMEKLATHLKKTNTGVMVMGGDRKNFLDAICDQLVTATGAAQCLVMDPVGGLNEVNRGNFSKFVDGKPIFDENGKIAKGPDYVKPDLTPFV
jgi:predicted HAD superfamily Cof-like phosphohydrolase